MSPTEILIVLAIAVGIAGIIVPVLPGTILVLGAILVWALEVGTTTAWAVFAVSAVLLVAGSVVKYLVPGRRLKDGRCPQPHAARRRAARLRRVLRDPRRRAVRRLRPRRLPRRAGAGRRRAGLAVDEGRAARRGRLASSSSSWRPPSRRSCGSPASRPPESPPWPSCSRSLQRSPTASRDFVGGLASRRTSAWPVAFVGSTRGRSRRAVGLALLTEGSPTRADLGGAPSPGSAAASAARSSTAGLAAGPDGRRRAGLRGRCRAPAGVRRHRRGRASRDLFVWVGIAAAVPGIWLVSREPGGVGRPRGGDPRRCPRRRRLRAAVRRDGPGARGGGIRTAGGRPGGGARSRSPSPLPRSARAGSPTTPRRRGVRSRACSSTAAAAAFLLATQTGTADDRGRGDVALPGGDDRPRRTVLRERVHAPQALGLALCGLAVALVAAA